LPEEVVRIEIDADHDAGDQHDNRSLNHLRLPRPLDLLELGPRLADEIEEAPEEPATPLNRLRLGTPPAAVALPVRRRLLGRTRRCSGPLRARSAALRPRLARH